MTPHPNVGTWIERHARTAPDRVALIFGETHRTYAELASRVRRLANGLRALGVTRGDRVAWLGANHPAFLEALFASAQVGAAVTPINHRLAPSLVADLCEATAPRVVLGDESVTSFSIPASATTVKVRSCSNRDSPYERLIDAHTDAPLDDAVSADDLCLLPFTSGTSGTPKGVMLSHANVTWNVMNSLAGLDVQSDDVTIAVVPFFRTGGSGVTVLPVLFKGGTVVIPRSSAADDVLRGIERHRATIGFGNPDLIDALTRSPLWRTADLTSLRLFVTGGAPVPERLLRACQQRRLTVLQGYGLSEAAPLVSVLDAANVLTKLGSAGRPVMFVDTRISRTDGADCGPGEIGELFARGPNVMTAYWRRPDDTRRAIGEDGWLSTGDAAFIDSDSFLFIVGRMSDAYVSGGQVVHPGFAERVLLEQPSVAEACVMGSDAGVVAYVVPAPGASPQIEAELLSVCRERLREVARPTAIRLVTSLPRNPAGKILRHQLR